MRFVFSPCGRSRENLSLLAAGVLPERERAAVEEHLAACPRCQKYFASVSSVTVPLRNWEQTVSHIEPGRRAEEQWAKEFESAIASVPRPRGLLISSLLDWFHDMIWPCRWVWTGFAAIWLGLFAIDFSTPDSTSSIATKNAAPSPAFVKAFLENEGLAAGLETPAVRKKETIHPTDQTPPPSRSEESSQSLRT